jgi:methylglyoxal reductase
MKTVRLGRTEARVPAISLGTWPHGGPRQVHGRDVGWSGHDDDLASRALLRAWEKGITHWDTADVYGGGHSERLIGALWDRVPRDDIFLATKVGWDPGRHDHYYHPRHVRECLERSLANLRTERVDLYYFHHCGFGSSGQHLEGALEVFHIAREQGKIRFIGLSDWDSRRIARYAPRVDPEVVQPYRNVVDDEYAASGLEAWVEAHDAGVAFFSPLKHGVLLGKYEKAPELPSGDFRRNLAELRDPVALRHLRDCRQAASRRFSRHPQPVLHALTGALFDGVTNACVLLGMRSPDQVDAAVTLGEALSPEDALWVRQLYRERDRLSSPA